MPIYQKPNTSRPAKGHKTYPYLLRGLRVERPNQVWCSDITYLPMRRGFLYLVAIMDWHNRKVLSWRISNTLEADFCVEALNEAIKKVRSDRDHEHGSGIPVHLFRLDRPAPPLGRADLDGRERPIPPPSSHSFAIRLPGSEQHLDRAALANPVIRMRLPACLGDRIRDESGHPEMDDLLQPPAPAFSPGRPASGAGLLAEK